jgi:hypothetical protein
MPYRVRGKAAASVSRVLAVTGLEPGVSLTSRAGRCALIWFGCSSYSWRDIDPDHQIMQAVTRTIDCNVRGCQPVHQCIAPDL